MQGKIVARNITKTGKLHFVVDVTVKPATDKTPAETRLVNSIMELAQVQMAQLIGSAVPTVGSNVICAFNVNPTTGAISDEWVSFVM